MSNVRSSARLHIALSLLHLPIWFLYFAELVIWLVTDKPIRVVSYHFPQSKRNPLPFLRCPVPFWLAPLQISKTQSTQCCGQNGAKRATQRRKGAGLTHVIGEHTRVFPNRNDLRKEPKDSFKVKAGSRMRGTTQYFRVHVTAKRARGTCECL